MRETASGAADRGPVDGVARGTDRGSLEQQPQPVATGTWQVTVCGTSLQTCTCHLLLHAVRDANVVLFRVLLGNAFADGDFAAAGARLRHADGVLDLALNRVGNADVVRFGHRHRDAFAFDDLAHAGSRLRHADRVLNLLAPHFLNEVADLHGRLRISCLYNVT